MMCQKMEFSNMQYFRILDHLNICMNSVGQFSAVGFTSTFENFHS